MKRTSLYIISAFFCAFIATSCQNPPGANPFAVTARADVQKALPYLRPGASVACSGVLALAVSDKDRADVAGDVFTIAGVIQALSGGGVVTPEQMRAAIGVATPKSSEFILLATTLQGIYAGVYPQIKGDPALALQVLNALAAGADDAAAVFIAQPAPPTPAPSP